MDTNTVIGTVVIVGAGHAGTQAADALRRAAFDGRLVLVTTEVGLPYQ
jgi:3-phenylpropionate/trans-cinnamate dioxygenase ferredoxin reductase subunit